MTPRRLINVQIALFAIVLLVFFLLSSAIAGEANICWTPPTKNTDGSALTDLAGYRVYYGSSAATLDKVVQVPNPAATCQVITNLLDGSTWHFGVRAYNSKGVDSGLSNIPTKSFTIPNPPSNVTVASTGYILEYRRDGIYRLVRNGTVPLGIPCEPIPGNVSSWLGLAGDRLAVCGPG